MFEKIKDLIYDISDYLVTIIIVFFIVISITFVMTKSYGLDFSKNDLLSLFQKEAMVEEEIETPASAPTEVEAETPSPELPETATPLEDLEEEEEEEEEEEDKEIIVEVYPGDGSYDVGDRLVEAGIIEDSYELALTLVERNLDTALQVGQYTFTKDMTLDQVIDVLFP